MDRTTPPVPPRLRDMLADYPELIEALAGALNAAATNPRGNPPYEMAVWALEDMLSHFVSDARDEFEAAEAGGDPQAIQRADDKLNLMFRARSPSLGLGDLDAVRAHFDSERKPPGTSAG
ncbi:hypothetical protein GLA29479_4761 [Lysobacter antibioticus]|uniref:hypothetical protein n=1 Tax=Lysobacter antibioticus TaxID=84531 RepID=UPI0007211B23|nr:hypothetical protein [Lysobacter antibioticus]ALN65591.1 hypothetical protein GLA29479_4761 [Lysobacter antibioticus]